MKIMNDITSPLIIFFLQVLISLMLLDKKLIMHIIVCFHQNLIMKSWILSMKSPSMAI